MSGILLALTIGFLLGILLMVFLVAGREEDNLLDRVERVEAARKLSAGAPKQPTGSAKQTSGAERSGYPER